MITDLRKKTLQCFCLSIMLAALFMLPCFARNFETTVSFVCVNNAACYDVELLLCKDGKIYVPFKQFCEVFGVEPQTNHSTHEISFSFKGRKGKVAKNKIEYDGKTISNRQNFYLKKGLMEEVKDEIFCDACDLQKIFNARIIPDRDSLSVEIQTEDTPEILKSLIIANEQEIVEEAKFRAYKNVSAPKKKKSLSFDSISLNNNTMSDATSQYMLGQTQKNVFFNNNTQIILGGKAYGGDYSVDLNTYNYKGEFFSFGGMGFNYKNKFKNLEYEIGRPTGIREKNYTIATQMFGAQLRNYPSKKENYRDISGVVDKDSLVKVFLDNEEFTTLSTYDGYYSLSDIFYNQEPKNIKLVELKADKTEKIILEKTFKDPDALFKGEKKYDIIAGVNGYNNKLFNQNGYIYEMNTKKFIAGAQYQYGISDKLKLDSKIIADRIYSTPKNSIWQSIYSADALLTSGTWKNPNNLDGITNLNTIYFKKNDSLTYKLTGGVSSARDLSQGNAQLGGYTTSAGITYKNDLLHAESELFTTSPDFYLAGGDGSFVNDRTGASVSLSASQNSSSINGRYKKYFSNTAKRFEGGLLEFDDYSFSASKNFEKLGNARFNINGRDGKNSFAHNKSYYYDLNFSKQLNSALHIEGGKTQSNYETSYNQEYNGMTGFKSLYSTVYAKADYRMPKRLGAATLGHDAVKYNYSGTENKYNMMKVGYTFPEFKSLTLSLGTGYKYSGDDKGFDFSVNLAVRTKSGRTVNLNYQFNRNGGYIINNMYMPMSNRHSINIVMNDVFAVLPNQIKSVGYNNPNRGFVEVVAYIDKNKNGKFDKDDIGVCNMPVKCSWLNDEVYTNRKGIASPDGADSGVYRVKIDTDKLPATLIQEKTEQNEKLVRIDKNTTTRVEFPLKSCAGNVSGKLKIVDDFGRTMNISDFIVVLLDEEGKEKTYSTVDKDGSFYMSGIEPGKYCVKLDQNLIEQNNLEDYEDKSAINIEIPYVYKDFADIKDLMLMYSTFSI